MEIVDEGIENIIINVIKQISDDIKIGISEIRDYNTTKDNKMKMYKSIVIYKNELREWCSYMNGDSDYIWEQLMKEVFEKNKRHKNKVKKIAQIKSETRKWQSKYDKAIELNKTPQATARWKAMLIKNKRILRKYERSMKRCGIKMIKEGR